MHDDTAADDGPVANGDVAAELNGVGHDYVVAEGAVVCNVRIGHDQAIGAHIGTTSGVGTAIECGEFADHGAVADDKCRVFAAKFQILGNRADSGAVVNLDIGTEAGTFGDARRLQSHLHSWLQQYVAKDPGASAAVRARYPLRDAKVLVREHPSDPGHFLATLDVWPHFQLDELTASVRLVTDLGSQ